MCTGWVSHSRDTVLFGKFATFNVGFEDLKRFLLFSSTDVSQKPEACYLDITIYYIRFWGNSVVS